MKQPFKSITEFGPLILFFVMYKSQGLIYATAALVVATLISTAITYFIEKKVPMMPLITALIVAFFGSLTVFSGDDIFIKIKPTLINLIFAGILIVGYYRDTGLLKHLLGASMKMNNRAWKIFSMRWAMFFIILAVANEFIWRNFSTDIWVDFKVFGIIGATFMFIITQIPFLQKNSIDEEKNIND